MPNRGRILVLLVVACIIVAGTLFQGYLFDQRLGVDRAREDATIHELNTADLALADAQLAQSGYVAAGQNSSAWMEFFDEALSRAEFTLREHQQTTLSAGALTHYDAALEQIRALRTSDGRARNYVGNEQLILASDVIFVESRGIIDRISENIAGARDTEVFEAQQSAALIIQYRQALAAGGMLFALLAATVAYRKTRAAPVEDAAAEAPASAGVQASDEPASDPAPVPSPTEIHPQLTDTADVCVDLARLLDGRDLPALLSRAAAAIGARGLVLWVLAESGESLRASVAHGYSERMLKRLGDLPVSADNVTSVACRTLQPQWVPGASADVPGALAVPLISVSGCVGVLSAEMADAQMNDHQMPLARLVAAQLSAVIGPDTASATTTAANEL